MTRSPASIVLSIIFLLALSSNAAAEKIFTITSEPEGARVEINGQAMGTTPYQNKVKDFLFNGPKYLWSDFLNVPLQVTVSKDGCEKDTSTLKEAPK